MHLSYREQYRNIEYTVNISDNDIVLDPATTVFRDTHNRKESDKDTLIRHVLKYHLINHVENHSEHYQFNLTKGTYRYQFSYTHKYRRWVRI